MRPDPWRHLAQHWPEVEAVHDLVVPGLWGLTEFDPVPRIRLHWKLTQVERRVTICHETRHLERGPVPRPLAGREEKTVRDLTARWLLPDLDELRRTLTTVDLHTAADELAVTFGVLVDRLNGLTDIESHHVHHRREDTE
jgi:hypothetical protein